MFINHTTMSVGKAVHFVDSSRRLLLRPHPKYGVVPSHADGLWEYSNMRPGALYRSSVRIRKVRSDSNPELFPKSALRNLRRYNRRMGYEFTLGGLRFEFHTEGGQRRYFIVYHADDGGMSDFAYEMQFDGYGALFDHPMWMRAGYMYGDATISLDNMKMRGQLYQTI